MIPTHLRRRAGVGLLIFSLLLVTAIYWPGLSGSWLFDDYPNIVDNHGVQPGGISVPTLVRAALSSPASELKRPLASLSFAANYLAVGLNPYWWKLTNLLIHLLNGVLVFVLARALLRTAAAGAHSRHKDIVAVLVAAAWMLLPINLTGVLYVVQRMESMANLFVLLGLIGYLAGRRRMLAAPTPSPASRGGLATEGSPLWSWGRSFLQQHRGFALCLFSIILPTALGVLAKETAVMLPLYALLIEWMLFRFRSTTDRHDWRIIGSFVIVLMLPMLIGLGWLLPGLLNPEAWATRDFTMSTRLLSEARIVVDYIRWTLLPTPHALSFYHDDFRVSTGLLAPWSTLASLSLLAALMALMLWLRSRRPLAALGIALFLGCHLLTGTILPLELIYEHRNYFASFGLLLAIVPMLAVPRSFPVARLRYALLGGLLLYWTTLTAMTAYAWGSPLRLARELASRAPQSPRAQYELGRTYIIDSHYDSGSPFTQLAYAPLEKAAALPNFSILPEQGLIFMNSRMQLPLRDAWWNSMIAKLKAHPSGVQDESALSSLTQCVREQRCNLPTDRMVQAFEAALSHPDPSARLLATYGDYAWNVLDDHGLGVHLTARAVHTKPDEPAYRITLVRMLVVLDRKPEARVQLQQLEPLNIGGRLDDEMAKLKQSVDPE